MYEYSYMGVLIGFGLWLIAESARVALDGFNTLNTTGVLISLSTLVLLVLIRTMGALEHKNTRVYIMLGISVLFGGVLGLGVIVSIVVGIYTVIQGVKHWKVIQELPTREEIKRARSIYLEGIDKEFETEEEKEEGTGSRKVAIDILEGFEGSEDHRREIETWIVEEDFNRLEYTDEEIKAIARQEIRENRVSLETMIALEELTKEDKEKEYFTEESVDFNVFELEGMEDLEVNYEEDLEEEDAIEENEDISLEDILGGR